MSEQTWPSWRYGPNGARKICRSPEEVPEGWADSPDRVAAEAPADSPAPAAKPKRAYHRKPK